jgi:hypothetical protein
VVLAALAALASATRLSAESARAFSIDVHVEEPSGVARRQSPCLASVPLPREASVHAASEITLLDESSVPVPCQTRILSRWDGKIADATKLARWVLLAFECDLGPHRAKTFRLVRRTNDFVPPAPVAVKLEDGHTLLDTGAVRARLGGASLVDNVTRSSGELLARTLRPYARVGDAEPVFAGTPEVEVLEAGPVRGVVRLTGSFAAAGADGGVGVPPARRRAGETPAPPIGYALTVEGWAGRPELRVSLETRSLARTVKLGELGLALDLPSLATGVLLPGGERGLTEHDALTLEQLAPVGKGKPRFELGLDGAARLADGERHEGWVAARFSGEHRGEKYDALAGAAARKPIARAPSGARVARDRVLLRFLAPERAGDAGPLRNRWLLEGQDRTDEALVFFGTSDPTADVTSFRSRLQGRPGTAWVRDAGGFFGPIATEEEERAAYAAAGVDVPTNVVKKRLLAEPEAEIEDPNVLWDTETDDARDLYVQWLRTGERGAFDEASAWAEFLRDRYTPRPPETASVDTGEAAEVAKKLHRSRWEPSHTYGEGLLASYLLTGDREALDAAVDLASAAEKKLELGDGARIREVRVFARPFQLAVGLLEVTAEERWRELALRFVATAFTSSTRDPALGCYAFKMSVGDFDLDPVLPKDMDLRARFPRNADHGIFKRGPRRLSIVGERACWPYQDRELAHALARAFEVTGDERAREALLGLADYYTVEGLVSCFHDPSLLEITPYLTLPYVPEPEVARYRQSSCPLYTTNLGLIEAAAYLDSGDERFRELAGRCLKIAALRAHGDLRPLGDERALRVRTTDQWGHGWDDQRSFLSLSRRHRPQPAAPTDVRARRGPREGTVEVSFEPGDDRAVAWVVLGAAKPIAPRAPRSEETSAFSATPAAREPASKGKARVVLVVSSGARNFVVRSEDAEHALSPPSASASVAD